MDAMLEDILTLARTGRAREPVRPVDLAALADAVVEEYRELGRPAAFMPSPRAVLEVQPNLLRRALRNLIDNATATAAAPASASPSPRRWRRPMAAGSTSPIVPKAAFGPASSFRNSDRSGLRGN
jgi:hypothetical protein